MDLKPFPNSIPFRKLLGPSFIILALGFGSGEIILWPYLTSNVGFGIAWGALLGITFQYFINMEIERYALIKGESVFVGLYKKWRWAPWWFIASTFIGFGLPGIIAASAQVLASLLGLASFKWLAVGLLLVIGLLLSSSSTVYGRMEFVTKIIIFIGLPFIFVLAFILSRGQDWVALLAGFSGFGSNYRWLPPGLSLATFLAAFAYAGAGGNLNLTQSIYIKEKGYGMGFYSQKMAGLFKNIKQVQKLKMEGEVFAINDSNIKNFKAWWRAISLEHLAVFWFLGFLGMCLLMVLSYVTTFGLESNIQGISFVINEGAVIGRTLVPWAGTLFLVVVVVMLFQTQLGVLDSTSRIMAENLSLKKVGHQGIQEINLSKIYFIFLWLQIGFGITLFLFNFYEPRTLIVLGAVINAIAMFVHIFMVNVMNKQILPRVFQPALWRQLILWLIFLFFGVFSIVTIWNSIISWLNL